MTDPLAVVALAKRYLMRPPDGAEIQAARTELGLTPTRYYQALNAAIDDPAIIALEPVTTRVLRQRRAHQRRQRVR